MRAESNLELPGQAELDAATWALGRIPQRIELRWAAALRAQGCFAEAAQLLDGIRRHHGETVGWLEESARLAFSTGEYDQAERFLRQRLERFPSATAEVALGRFLLEQDRPEEAEAIVKPLVATYADHLTVTLLAADVARAKGQREIARGYYLAVVDARGEHPSGLLMMAELALEDGNLKVAREFQRRVLHAYDEGGYRLTPSAALKIARIADALGDSETAGRIRERGEVENLAMRSATAAEIWNALEEVGALRGRSEPEAPLEGAEPVPEPEPIVAAPEPEPMVAAPARVASEGERPARPEVLAALSELFGHNTFRPGQTDVIERVLDGIDTLAIIPTGGGKSLTYQLPAMLTPGVTLVISPLIALMKDQVESAPPALRDRITLINSDIDAGERHRRLERVQAGEIKLLYVAPERLLDPTLRRALLSAGLARVVIDEAHCISLWGHDFRPDYLTIPLALRDLGDPPLLAVTATATPEMAEQIGVALGRRLDLVRTSVFRPNLFYEVIELSNRDERVEQMIELCRQERGTGIVYVSSRQDAETHAGTLNNRGVRAAAYHAGLSREERATAYEQFMSGRVRVIVATVAFGMGVDKADVRFIIHMLPPGTVEAYAQESGRAGRDGELARCVMLTTRTDRTTLRSRAKRDLVSIETLRQVYREVRARQRSGWSAIDIQALDRRLNEGIDERDRIETRVALGYLQQARLIARAPDAPVRFRIRRIPHVVTDDDPGWEALLSRLGDGWTRGEPVELDAAETSAALGIEPAQLDALLGDRADVRLDRDYRSAWYRLLPAPADASRLMERLLDQATRRANDRIDQVMAYTEGHACRHRLLAAALGEEIAPCGNTCDVCSPRAATGTPATARKTSRAARTATVDDALLILRTLPDLPYQMGKRGLVWLLIGSPESRLQGDRSPVFGALAELGATRIGRLVDQLVEGGFMAWETRDEFRLVALTAKGARATREDLEFLPGFSAPVSRSVGSDGEITLDASDQLLFERLVAWRQREAVEQRLPAYTIAHNTSLREIARLRPSTPEQLGNISGFGQKRTERYGAVILRLVAES